MATAAILAARAQTAHERTMEVVEAHGRPEHLEILQNMTVAQATTRNPDHLAGFQAELIASLAEIVEAQERRITKLEEAAAPAAASKKAAKK